MKTSGERFRQVLEHFDAVCDLPTSERSAYLDRECGSDVQLRAEVEHLLDHDTSIAARVEAAADVFGVKALLPVEGSSGEASADAGDSGEVALPLPERIGPYRVRRKLGEGGMGIVYEADQEHPRRRVALKMVRDGRLGPQQAGRLKREAHALGRLQHPGIASIHELGTAELHGVTQPYFAMELVEGPRITAFAAAQQLSTQQRVELMVRVCDAVQHAHQKGVIHRDLKPGNILVTRADSSEASSSRSDSRDLLGQPKILDFGIARLTDSDNDVNTWQTQAGHMVGTLAYMSPEQVSGDIQRVDTRTDVYGLGVNLYQLLTGALPFDLTGCSLLEAADKIQHQAVPPLRRHDPRLRGDLEIIVARALEKDPDRRYASAGELAEDLRRYLNDQPILARPSSALYQLQKFARRHRALVSVIGISGAAAIALIIGLTVQTLRLNEQRDAATALARDATAARDEANEQARAAIEARDLAAKRAEETSAANAKAGRLQSFQTSMLRDVDPAHVGKIVLDELRASYIADKDEAAKSEAEAQLESVTLGLDTATLGRQLIDESILTPAVDSLDASFGDDPLLEADMRHSLGLTYSELGLFEPAREQFEVAHALRDEFLGPVARDTLSSRFMVIGMRAQLGDREDARTELIALIETQRAEFGDVDNDVGQSLRFLAEVNSALIRNAEAIECYREAISILEATQEPGALDALNAQAGLGRQLYRDRQFQAARPILEGVLEALEGRNSPEAMIMRASTRGDLGNVLYVLRERQAAHELRQMAFDELFERLGAEHPKTLEAQDLLTLSHHQLRNYDEAIAMAKELIATLQRVRGPYHPATLNPYLHQINAHMKLGQYAEAEAVAREFLDRVRLAHGPEHETELIVHNMLVFCLMPQERYEDALEVLERLLPMAMRQERELYIRTDQVLASIGTVHSYLGDQEQSVDYYQQAIDRCRETIGIGHRDTAGVVVQLADEFMRMGRSADAIEVAAAVLAEVDAEARPNPVSQYILNRFLGRTLHTEAEYARAEVALRRAIEFAESRGRRAWQTSAMRCLRGHALIMTGDPESGTVLLTQGRDELLEIPEPQRNDAILEVLAQVEGWLETTPS